MDDYLLVLGSDLQEIGLVKGREQVQVRGTGDVSGLEEVIGAHVHEGNAPIEQSFGLGRLDGRRSLDTER